MSLADDLLEQAKGLLDLPHPDCHHCVAIPTKAEMIARSAGMTRREDFAATDVANMDGHSLERWEK